MKPAYCWLCGRDFRSEWRHAQSGGELVRFRDYKQLPDDAVGHPPGLEWFCREHAAAARVLSHLDSASALVELQRQFGSFPKVIEPSLIHDPSLWVVEVGPQRSRVLAVIQQATGRTATDALVLLRATPFELVRGWPASFQSWRVELESVGARVEVRYDQA
ncbi:hypothetical protein [Roseimicrobium sp. ORNL1]|uniref:hypothetical protein n=1 Tax=Roseimicrobium sp. ORNL1 TaxID=2711231 RepID=UPI0013E14A83|nr:hypothetical protein [Roseimicrobium sp. ORNL1]QIF02481.1 hypothetical protein G5S37_13410 [Roseimicrobium sp. ORNL1]